MIVKNVIKVVVYAAIWMLGYVAGQHVSFEDPCALCECDEDPRG